MIVGSVIYDLKLLLCVTRCFDIRAASSSLEFAPTIGK